MTKTMVYSLRSFLRTMPSGILMGRSAVTTGSISFINCSDCWNSRTTHGQSRSISTTTSVEKRIDDKITSFNFLEERNSLGLSNAIFGNYEKVSPGQVSDQSCVPDFIRKPDYYSRLDGSPSKPASKKPGIKNQQEIEYMRESCILAKYILEKTISKAKAGVTTDQLDKFAHELTVKNNAFPSALGYRKYPKSICTSVNNVACHGIPDNRKLITGDIISIDVMVYKNGFHGDCCGTSLIGNVDEQGRNLVRVAEECTARGIQACGPNVPFEKIGEVIEAYATLNGLSVVPTFTGHGIGKNIHEKPEILHYDCKRKGKLDVMLPGMVFTVEPVITQGMDLVIVLSDGWTAITVDGSRTAQFENTILITDDGVEILTRNDFTSVRLL